MSTITKADEIAALQKLINDYFTIPGKTSLVQDGTTDEITPYTDAIATHATAINPLKGYPGQAK